MFFFDFIFEYINVPANKTQNRKEESYMKNKKKKTYQCPYCGNQAVLRDAKHVHGNNTVTKYVYVCYGYPECDSYVTAHKHTMEPMGTLANGDLRSKRIQAHQIFDRI